MPIFKIHHVTKYEYDRSVKESSNEIKIFPVINNDQEVLQHDLVITGNPDVYIFEDYWNNRIGLFNLLPPHKNLLIESKLVIRTTQSSSININFISGWEELKKETDDVLQLLELSKPSLIQSQQKINEIIEILQPEKKSIAQVVGDCNAYIFNEFKYIKGITDIETTVDEILEHRSGVCQDFAHLMLQILRTLNIPCRYVSGYICPNKNGMRGEGATHAWVEAFIPANGWAGIDPTNNVWVTNTHVKLSVGKDFNDCTPVKGTFKGPAKQNLSVYVSIGYEDGHVFEEINNVELQTQLTQKEEVLIDESFGQQQQ